eukprot:12368140-Alexandrium_andersonii.AAC.1
MGIHAKASEVAAASAAMGSAPGAAPVVPQPLPQRRASSPPWAQHLEVAAGQPPAGRRSTLKGGRVTTQFVASVLMLQVPFGLLLVIG